MENWIFIDETFYKKEKAKISVYNHELLYGDGVYEGIRCYSRNVFQLNEHTDRLYKSAKSIRLEIKYSKEDALNKVVKQYDYQNIFTDMSIIVENAAFKGLNDISTPPNRMVYSLIASTKAIQNYHLDKLVRK